MRLATCYVATYSIGLIGTSDDSLALDNQPNVTVGTELLCNISSHVLSMANNLGSLHCTVHRQMISRIYDSGRVGIGKFLALLETGRGG